MIQLKRYRLELDKTQAYIAKCLGISQQTYANYENAETQAPHDILIKAADYFKISVDELLGHDTEKVATPKLTESQQKIMDILPSLNEQQCSAVLNMIEAFNTVATTKEQVEMARQIRKFEDK